MRRKERTLRKGPTAVDHLFGDAGLSDFKSDMAAVAQG